MFLLKVFEVEDSGALKESEITVSNMDYYAYKSEDNMYYGQKYFLISAKNIDIPIVKPVKIERVFTNSALK
jgi:hypothetical protein